MKIDLKFVNFKWKIKRLNSFVWTIVSSVFFEKKSILSIVMVNISTSDLILDQFSEDDNNNNTNNNSINSHADIRYHFKES